MEEIITKALVVFSLAASFFIFGITYDLKIMMNISSGLLFGFSVSMLIDLVRS